MKSYETVKKRRRKSREGGEEKTKNLFAKI